jgi:hypothetical protein
VSKASEETETERRGTVSIIPLDIKVFVIKCAGEAHAVENGGLAGKDAFKGLCEIIDIWGTGRGSRMRQKKREGERVRTDGRAGGSQGCPWRS